MVSSGLLDQTISYQDYLEMLDKNMELKKKLGIDKNSLDKKVDPNNNEDDPTSSASFSKKLDTGNGSQDNMDLDDSVG